MRLGKQHLLLIDIIWCALLALYIQAGTAIVPFHGDESLQIFMGRDYFYQFVEGDLSRIEFDETWSSRTTQQHLRLINGTITKYLFGWIIATNGLTIDDINRPWRGEKDYATNIEEGRMPGDNLLIPTRSISAVQLAFAIIAYFIIVQTVFNRPIAYISSLYLTLNPAVLANGRRAMMEGSHLLFMLLVILAGLWVIQRRRWWTLIILGIFSGLAVAAKHPNAMIVTLVMSACGSYAVIQSIRQTKSINRKTLQLIMGLVSSGVIALFVFYLLNPVWWGDPITRVQSVIDERTKLLTAQVQNHAPDWQLSDRIQTFLDFTFIARFEEFDKEPGSPELSDQIERYETSLLAGVPIGGSLIGGIIVALLFVFGVIHMARNHDILPSYRWLILIWGLGIMIFILIVNPLPWQRYYLPIYPFVGLILAYSLHTLVTMVRQRYTNQPTLMIRS